MQSNSRANGSAHRGPHMRRSAAAEHMHELFTHMKTSEARKHIMSYVQALRQKSRQTDLDAPLHKRDLQKLACFWKLNQTPNFWANHPTEDDLLRTLYEHARLLESSARLDADNRHEKKLPSPTHGTKPPQNKMVIKAPSARSLMDLRDAAGSGSTTGPEIIKAASPLSMHDTGEQTQMSDDQDESNLYTGDLFGTRGSYEDGIIYASRNARAGAYRSILRPDGDQNDTGTYESANLASKDEKTLDKSDGEGNDKDGSDSIGKFANAANNAFEALRLSSTATLANTSYNPKEAARIRTSGAATTLFQTWRASKHPLIKRNCAITLCNVHMEEPVANDDTLLPIISLCSIDPTLDDLVARLPASVVHLKNPMQGAEIMARAATAIRRRLSGTRPLDTVYFPGIIAACTSIVRLRDTTLQTRKECAEALLWGLQNCRELEDQASLIDEDDFDISSPKESIHNDMASYDGSVAKLDSSPTSVASPSNGQAIQPLALNSSTANHDTTTNHDQSHENNPDKSSSKNFGQSGIRTIGPVSKEGYAALQIAIENGVVPLLIRLIEDPTMEGNVAPNNSSSSVMDVTAAYTSAEEQNLISIIQEIGTCALANIVHVPTSRRELNGRVLPALLNLVSGQNENEVTREIAVVVLYELAISSSPVAKDMLNMAAGIEALTRAALRQGKRAAVALNEHDLVHSHEMYLQSITAKYYLSVDPPDLSNEQINRPIDEWSRFAIKACGALLYMSMQSNLGDLLFACGAADALKLWFELAPKLNDSQTIRKMSLLGLANLFERGKGMNGTSSDALLRLGFVKIMIDTITLDSDHNIDTVSASSPKSILTPLAACVEAQVLAHAPSELSSTTRRCAKAMCALSDSDPRTVNLLLQEGIVPALLRIADSPTSDAQSRKDSLRALRNLVQHTQSISFLLPYDNTSDAVEAQKEKENPPAEPKNSNTHNMAIPLVPLLLRIGGMTNDIAELVDVVDSLVALSRHPECHDRLLAEQSCQLTLTEEAFTGKILEPQSKVKQEPTAPPSSPALSAKYSRTRSMSSLSGVPEETKQAQTSDNLEPIEENTPSDSNTALVLSNTDSLQLQLCEHIVPGSSARVAARQQQGGNVHVFTGVIEGILDIDKGRYIGTIELLSRIALIDTPLRVPCMAALCELSVHRIAHGPLIRYGFLYLLALYARAVDSSLRRECAQAAYNFTCCHQQPAVSLDAEERSAVATALANIRTRLSSEQPDRRAALVSAAAKKAIQTYQDQLSKTISSRELQLVRCGVAAALTIGALFRSDDQMTKDLCAAALYNLAYEPSTRDALLGEGTLWASIKLAVEAEVLAQEQAAVEEEEAARVFGLIDGNSDDDSLDSPTLQSAAAAAAAMDDPDRPLASRGRGGRTSRQQLRERQMHWQRKQQDEKFSVAREREASPALSGSVQSEPSGTVVLPPTNETQQTNSSAEHQNIVGIEDNSTSPVSQQTHKKEMIEENARPNPHEALPVSFRRQRSNEKLTRPTTAASQKTTARTDTPSEKTRQRTKGITLPTEDDDTSISLLSSPMARTSRLNARGKFFAAHSRRFNVDGGASTGIYAEPRSNTESDSNPNIPSLSNNFTTVMTLQGGLSERTERSSVDESMYGMHSSAGASNASLDSHRAESEYSQSKQRHAENVTGTNEHDAKASSLSQTDNVIQAAKRSSDTTISTQNMADKLTTTLSSQEKQSQDLEHQNNTDRPTTQHTMYHSGKESSRSNTRQKSPNGIGSESDHRVRAYRSRSANRSIRSRHEAKKPFISRDVEGRTVLVLPPRTYRIFDCQLTATRLLRNLVFSINQVPFKGIRDQNSSSMTAESKVLESQSSNIETTGVDSRQIRSFYNTVAEKRSIDALITFASSHHPWVRLDTSVMLAHLSVERSLRPVVLQRGLLAAIWECMQTPDLPISLRCATALLRLCCTLESAELISFSGNSAVPLIDRFIEYCDRVVDEWKREKVSIERKPKDVDQSGRDMNKSTTKLAKGFLTRHLGAHRGVGSGSWMSYDHYQSDDSSVHPYMSNAPIRKFSNAPCVLDDGSLPRSNPTVTSEDISSTQHARSLFSRVLLAVSAAVRRLCHVHGSAVPLCEHGMIKTIKHLFLCVRRARDADIFVDALTIGGLVHDSVLSLATMVDQTNSLAPKSSTDVQSSNNKTKLENAKPPARPATKTQKFPHQHLLQINPQRRTSAHIIHALDALLVVTPGSEVIHKKPILARQLGSLVLSEVVNSCVLIKSDSGKLPHDSVSSNVEQPSAEFSARELQMARGLVPVTMRVIANLCAVPGPAMQLQLNTLLIAQICAFTSCVPMSQHMQRLSSNQTEKSEATPSESLQSQDMNALFELEDLDSQDTQDMSVSAVGLVARACAARCLSSTLLSSKLDRPYIRIMHETVSVVLHSASAFWLAQLPTSAFSTSDTVLAESVSERMPTYNMSRYVPETDSSIIANATVASVLTSVYSLVRGALMQNVPLSAATNKLRPGIKRDASPVRHVSTDSRVISERKDKPLDVAKLLVEQPVLGYRSRNSGEKLVAVPDDTLQQMLAFCETPLVSGVAATVLMSTLVLPQLEKLWRKSLITVDDIIVQHSTGGISSASSSVQAAESVGSFYNNRRRATSAASSCRRVDTARSAAYVDACSIATSILDGSASSSLVEAMATTQASYGATYAKEHKAIDYGDGDDYANIRRVTAQFCLNRAIDALSSHYPQLLHAEHTGLEDWMQLLGSTIHSLVFYENAVAYMRRLQLLGVAILLAFTRHTQLATALVNMDRKATEDSDQPMSSAREEASTSSGLYEGSVDTRHGVIHSLLVAARTARPVVAASAAEALANLSTHASHRAYLLSKKIVPTLASLASRRGTNTNVKQWCALALQHMSLDRNLQDSLVNDARLVQSVLMLMPDADDSDDGSDVEESKGWLEEPASSPVNRNESPVIRSGSFRTRSSRPIIQTGAQAQPRQLAIQIQDTSLDDDIESFVTATTVRENDSIAGGTGFSGFGKPGRTSISSGRHGFGGEFGIASVRDRRTPAGRRSSIGSQSAGMAAAAAGANSGTDQGHNQLSPLEEARAAIPPIESFGLCDAQSELCLRKALEQALTMDPDSFSVFTPCTLRIPKVDYVQPWQNEPSSPISALDYQCTDDPEALNSSGMYIAIKKESSDHSVEKGMRRIDSDLTHNTAQWFEDPDRPSNWIKVVSLEARPTHISVADTVDEAFRPSTYNNASFMGDAGSSYMENGTAISPMLQAAARHSPLMRRFTPLNEGKRDSLATYLREEDLHNDDDITLEKDMGHPYGMDRTGARRPSIMQLQDDFEVRSMFSSPTSARENEFEFAGMTHSSEIAAVNGQKDSVYPRAKGLTHLYLVDDKRAGHAIAFHAFDRRTAAMEHRTGPTWHSDNQLPRDITEEAETQSIGNKTPSAALQRQQQRARAQRKKISAHDLAVLRKRDPALARALDAAAAVSSPVVASMSAKLGLGSLVHNQSVESQNMLQALFSDSDAPSGAPRALSPIAQQQLRTLHTSEFNASTDEKVTMKLTPSAAKSQKRPFRSRSSSFLVLSGDEMSDNESDASSVDSMLNLRKPWLRQPESCFLRSLSSTTKGLSSMGASHVTHGHAAPDNTAQNFLMPVPQRATQSNNRITPLRQSADQNSNSAPQLSLDMSEKAKLKREKLAAKALARRGLLDATEQINASRHPSPFVPPALTQEQHHLQHAQLMEDPRYQLEASASSGSIGDMNQFMSYQQDIPTENSSAKVFDRLHLEGRVWAEQQRNAREERKQDLQNEPFSLARMQARIDPVNSQPQKFSESKRRGSATSKKKQNKKKLPGSLAQYTQDLQQMMVGVDKAEKKRLRRLRRELDPRKRPVKHVARRRVENVGSVAGETTRNEDIAGASLPHQSGPNTGFSIPDRGIPSPFIENSNNE